MYSERRALVGLHDFYRLDGTAFAAEYTLRTMQPGVRILTVAAVREEPISEKAYFHTGPNDCHRERNSGGARFILDSRVNLRSPCLFFALLVCPEG